MNPTPEKASTNGKAEAEKLECRGCHRYKPADQFHNRTKSPTGKSYRCKDCAYKDARASAEKKRGEMGEEAWREHNRLKRIKQRGYQRDGTANDYDRKMNRARIRALSALAKLHPEDYQRIYLEEKTKQGIPPKIRERSPMKKSRLK